MSETTQTAPPAPTTMRGVFDAITKRRAPRGPIIVQTFHMPRIKTVVHPLDAPEQTVKGWRGSNGTIVLSSHIDLTAYPHESFIADDITFYGDPEFADALRSLQDDAANLQHRVWQLEDDAQ